MAKVRAWHVNLKHVQIICSCGIQTGRILSWRPVFQLARQQLCPPPPFSFQGLSLCYLKGSVRSSFVFWSRVPSYTSNTIWIKCNCRCWKIKIVNAFWDCKTNRLQLCGTEMQHDALPCPSSRFLWSILRLGYCPCGNVLPLSVWFSCSFRDDVILLRCIAPTSQCVFERVCMVPCDGPASHPVCIPASCPVFPG